MPALVGRLVRITKTAGLAAAVLAAPLTGFADTRTAPHTPAPTQLAQAAPRSGAPQRQTQPAQPPAPAAAAADQEVERQITDLRRKLSLTPAQQPPFEALAQAMRQNAKDMDTLAQQEPQNRNPNAVEAVRAAGRFAEAEAEGLKRLLPPLQALYDTLSEPQKRAADQVFASSPDQEQPPAKRR